MMFILGQIPSPTDAENSWMWLSLVLVGAIGALWKQHSDGSTAEKTSLREERDKERARNDVLLDSIPEMVTVLRELKDYIVNQPQK